MWSGAGASAAARAALTSMPLKRGSVIPATLVTGRSAKVAAKSKLDLWRFAQTGPVWSVMRLYVDSTSSGKVTRMWRPGRAPSSGTFDVRRCRPQGAADPR